MLNFKRAILVPDSGRQGRGTCEWCIADRNPRGGGAPSPQAVRSHNAAGDVWSCGVAWSGGLAPPCDFEAIHPQDEAAVPVCRGWGG
jgi:hypothetical protein